MKVSNDILHDKGVMPIETHPWAPYIPRHPRVLIMGTFPPGEHRRSMDFYYPNRTNDFWPMMGLIFYGDRNALLRPGTKDFNLDAIRRLLDEKGVAMNDTGYRIRRLAGNASDKFLEIVEPVDLKSLLAQMPECKVIATTGEKAASVIAALTDTPAPAMGKCVEGPDGIKIWRMPSTSRAYPLSLDRKAEYYAEMFSSAGII